MALRRNQLYSSDMSKAREYIDFWVENSVHSAENYTATGASQDVSLLVERLIEGAKEQDISADAMQEEVGDLTEYIRGKLETANRIDRHRRANNC
jgi:hypothetical protein